MNISTSTLLSYAAMIGLSSLDTALEPMVQGYILLNPAATDAQVEAGVEGQLKHAARTKIGFAVDFVWPVLDSYLTTQIATLVPQARAALATPVTVAPPPVVPS